MKVTKPLTALRNRVRAVNWSRFTTFRAWRRWFTTSLVQSGRLTVLLALIFVYFVRIDDPVWMQYVRAKTFDIYQIIKPRPFHPDTPVVIVDIDEKSIAELAQWQWPRTILAKLVDRLTEMGAKVISFDIVFAEPDRTSFRTLAASPGVDLDDETRARLSKTRDNDAVFADSIKASGRVVLGQPIITASKTYPEERPTTSFVAIGSDPNPNLEQFPGILRNLYEIDAAGEGHGIFAYSSSIDGIVRSVPMVIRADNVRYPSLSLETLRVYQGARSIYIKSADDGVQGLLLRSRTGQKYEVSTDRHTEVRVYYTPHEAYAANYISVTDIINGRVDPARIAGKMVLVGTSAAAILDIRTTPLDAIIPGVEVHANILENVVFGEGLVRPPIAEGLEVVAAMALSLVVIVVTPWLGAVYGAASFFLLSGGMVWWSWNAFAQHRELYDPVFSVVVAFLIYSFLTLAARNREEGQKRQIRGAFGQYLSPAVVEQLANDPSQLKLGGENRDMTFMFSDVRGFTTISELFDAEGLTKLINRLLTPLTDVIYKRQGTIDKYMGDCVMAFWNAPLPVQGHEREACRACFEMLDSVKVLNEELEAEAKTQGREHRPLAVGIGVNSGIACVGNMGSAQRFGYTVLGDNVNLASRLEGQSKSYGVTIVIGESTSEQVHDFAVLELDLIKVKGKTEAVRIFTLVGDEPVAKSADYLALKAVHDQMLAAYRAQRWDEADTKIAEAHAITARASGLIHQMDHFYEIYAERIAEYRAHPPGPNWDAVYVATSK